MICDIGNGKENILITAIYGEDLDSGPSGYVCTGQLLQRGDL